MTDETAHDSDELAPPPPQDLSQHPSPTEEKPESTYPPNWDNIPEVPDDGSLPVHHDEVPQNPEVPVSSFREVTPPEGLFTGDRTIGDRVNSVSEETAKRNDTSPTPEQQAEKDKAIVERIKHATQLALTGTTNTPASTHDLGPVIAAIYQDLK